VNEINCPYCGKPQEICHDDGYGYMEDEVYRQECCDCEKTFVYTTSIIFLYDAKKADCLNGSPHEWKATTSFPKKYTKMYCVHCDETRECTTSEMQGVFND
jgi:hypothetical protein